MMRSLLSQLVLPLPVFWMLAVTAGILYLRQKKTVARCFGVLSLVWLLAFSTPFLPDVMVSSLENRYRVCSPSALQAFDRPVNVLVLGGGHTSDNRLPASDQLSTTALARLAEGIRLHRLIPASTLITSGYKGKSDDTQAEMLAKAAVLLGVGPAGIKVQTGPANTLGEAREYKRLFGDAPVLIVVTSAVHMPRAMYLFHKAGLKPIAAPADHLVKNGNKPDPLLWMPSSGNIHKAENAIHEYAGLLWSKLGGE